jgi:hypothetical protein
MCIVAVYNFAQNRLCKSDLELVHPANTTISLRLKTAYTISMVPYTAAQQRDYQHHACHRHYDIIYHMHHAGKQYDKAGWNRHA